MPQAVTVGLDPLETEMVRRAVAPAAAVHAYASVGELLEEPQPEVIRTAVVVASTACLAEVVAGLRCGFDANGDAPPPVVAVIADVGCRESVLNQGAADSLVRPLLCNEIAARLKPYLGMADMATSYKAAQSSATRMALVLLISRLIAEDLELQEILSRTLEQTTSLLGASGGGIWLLSDDKTEIRKAAFLSSAPPGVEGAPSCRTGQGLIGQGFVSDKPLNIPRADEDPRFDDAVDAFGPIHGAYSVIGTKLKRAGCNLGFLALHNAPPKPFSPGDLQLLQDVAGLVAVAVSDAQVIQALRNEGDEQRILYGMGQEIAEGLDLPTTLQRIIGWVGRLADYQAGAVWLSNMAEDAIKVAAAYGLELPAGDGIPITSLAAGQGTIVIGHGPRDDPLTLAVCQTLGIEPMNGLIIPLLQRGHAIGMVTLFDKPGPLRVEDDLRLLGRAIRMISISLHNAQLHAQLVALLEERERLHDQALHNERLRTIGRLTAHLAHKINNPMQSILGALTLILESAGDPPQVAEWVGMCRDEVARVVELVGRMRQLYRPTLDPPGPVDLGAVLSEAIEAVGHEMGGQNVVLRREIPGDLPPVAGRANQIRVALLSLLLHMVDGVGVLGGGALMIGAHCRDHVVRVQITADALQEEPNKNDDACPVTPMIDGLSIVGEVIRANRGSLEIRRGGQHPVLCLELPCAS